MITDDICRICQKCCIGVLTENGMCPHLTSTGCKFKWEDRDDGCKAYPFVIIDDDRSMVKRRYFLDTACPYWRVFGDQLDQLKKDKLGPTIFLRK